MSVTPAACESDFSAHSLILYRGLQSVNGDLREFSRFLGGPLRVRLHATYQVINKSRLFNPSGCESVELFDRRLTQSQRDLDATCGRSSGSWSLPAVCWFVWHTDSFMLSPPLDCGRAFNGAGHCPELGLVHYTLSLAASRTIQEKSLADKSNLLRSNTLATRNAATDLIDESALRIAVNNSFFATVLENTGSIISVSLVVCPTATYCGAGIQSAIISQSV